MFGRVGKRLTGSFGTFLIGRPKTLHKCAQEQLGCAQEALGRPKETPLGWASHSNLFDRSVFVWENSEE